MNHTPISLTRDDHAKLRLLVTAALRTKATASLEQLREELDRASIFDAAEIPPGVVTMDADVEFEDLRSGEVETYAITLPEHANLEKRRISVLAPIGAALIGYREGDEVEWSTPGGIRRLKIRRVTPSESSSARGTPAEQTLTQ